MARHPVATLCSQSAGWVLPVVGIGLFLHKHFIADVGSTNPADARFKAVARCKHAPKGQRRVRRRPSPITEATNQTDTLEQQLQQQERELTDAVLGNDTVYEWFNEDEVEALQQAQAQSNPQALLDLLHHYGSRMAAEGFIHDEDDQDSDGSLWYTDEPEQGWQQDSPSISPQKQQQPDSAQAQRQQQQQDAGQQFLRQLAAAQPQQQQDGAQQGADRAASPAGSDAHAEGDYFDDSYFGLPADESAAPRDLQELQAAVSKNLEALLPKDSTWTGSYPPRFDEVLSPADAGGYINPGSEGGYITGGDGGGYIGPPPEFDFDLDPGFDYVPDFDYDPDFDPDFDDDMLDMFDFDIEP